MDVDGNTIQFMAIVLGTFMLNRRMLNVALLEHMVGNPVTSYGLKSETSAQIPCGGGMELMVI